MHIKRIIKLWYFRIKYINKRVSLGNGSNIALCSRFEGCNAIGKNTTFIGTLGFGSYICENSTIWGSFGRFCSIASDVKVLAGTHPISRFISTSPVFYSLQKQSNITFARKQEFEEFLYADADRKHTIIVGNDVWIGTGAIIVGGVKIGDGAVVLANAAVTKDVQPYEIVGGVPAKIVGNRFDGNTREFLMDFKWWNMSQSWLRENAEYFTNAESFVKKFSNKN